MSKKANERLDKAIAEVKEKATINCYEHLDGFDGKPLGVGPAMFVGGLLGFFVSAILLILFPGILYALSFGYIDLLSLISGNFAAGVIGWSTMITSISIAVINYFEGKKDG